jgi:small subunit ribosomal protein S3
MKQAMQAAMRMGAEGIRIRAAGRLGGAEMGRTEEYMEGRVPLHTIRADIDFSQETALTIYGTIGVKVWIHRGEILGQPDLSPNVQAQQRKMKESPQQRRQRRGGS